MFAEAAKLGLDPDLLAQLPPEMAIRVESMIGEEMGWGDAGLAVSLTVTSFPLEMAKAMGNQELIDLSTGKIGCWMITHPDKGTDVGAFDMKREWAPGQQGNKGTMLAKVGKDEIVINGQCSAWVSNGAVAQVALGYLGADYGDGFFDADGRPNGVGLHHPARPAWRLQRQAAGKNRPACAAAGRDLLRQRQDSQALCRGPAGRVLRQRRLRLVVRRHPHGADVYRRCPRGLRNGAGTTATSASRAASC